MLLLPAVDSLFCAVVKVAEEQPWIDECLAVRVGPRVQRDGNGEQVIDGCATCRARFGMVVDRSSMALEEWRVAGADRHLFFAGINPVDLDAKKRRRL